MTVRKVAMLTAGGLAPCLSSAVGGLIERYTELAPDVELIAYTDGYAGLLTGSTVEVTPRVRERAHARAHGVIRHFLALLHHRVAATGQPRAGAEQQAPAPGVTG